MILISLVLIVLYNYFLTKKLEFRRSLDVILVNFLFACSNIILSFEITSLLRSLNDQSVFILVQIVLLAGAIIFYRAYKEKSPRKALHFKEESKEFFSFCKSNKTLMALFVFIVLVYLSLAYLSFIFPQNTTDSLYNHLARIAHWLQQGSLKPYDSFSLFGINYPYNNSLLMMWSILFTHADNLTGLVQWFATIILALAIYGLATILKFSKQQAGFSALIFLTFPILILESITAQNDILAAAFLLIGIYFFIDGFQTSNSSQILFSSMSIALAAGTKQYLLFIVPGFFLVFIFFVLKKEIDKRFILARNFVLLTLGFTLLIGSYTYIQNSIFYKNPVGSSDSNYLSSSKDGTLSNKLAFNSARLTTQFLSCEGLPLPAENSCLEIKGNIFRKVFSQPSFNLESNQFMLNQDCGSTCFSYSQRYPLNEESAWYGFLSWVLIIPGVVIAIIRSLRKKDYLPILLILTSLIYFLIISVFKAGWDAYLGRYLILSVALVMPFIGYFYSDKTLLRKFFTGLLTATAIFILCYTFLSNDSKPLVSKSSMVNVQKWGKSHALLITKIAYKMTPWFDNQKNYFEYNYQGLKTYFARDMAFPLTMVNNDLPLNANLGIIADRGIFMDYLFWGDNFTRKIFDLPDYSDQKILEFKIQENKIDYLLICPEISVILPQQFKLIDNNEGWSIYKRE